jgi:hypothetical protein
MGKMWGSRRELLKAHRLAVIIYLDGPDAEGCGSSTGKTHIRVRIFPSHESFKESSDALEPDLRISRDGTPSKLNPTTHQDCIHQLDCALYARQLKHFSKLRVDGNVTRSLVARCSAVKTDQAVIAPTMPALCINPDGVSGTHSALLATVAA